MADAELVEARRPLVEVAPLWHGQADVVHARACLVGELSLAFVGKVTLLGLAAGAALIPLVIVGYVVAGHLRGRLDSAGVRVFVLVISSVAGAGLLVDAVTG